MKKFFMYALLAITASLLAMAFGFAQDIVAPIPTVDFLSFLVTSLGGVKGASALAIAGIVSKVLLSFVGSELFDKWFKGLEGGVKLFISLALSFVSGLIALKMSGVDWAAALVHSSTLSAFVVLSNQAYKQWFEKKKV